MILEWLAWAFVLTPFVGGAVAAWLYWDPKRCVLGRHEWGKPVWTGHDWVSVCVNGHVKREVNAR